MFDRVLLLVSLSVGACWAKIPDFIHPCDTLESKCLTQAAQEAVPYFVEGLPEYEIPKLDPFLSDPVNMSLPGIDFSLYNGRALGLRKAIVDLIEVIPNENRLRIHFHTNLTIKGQYLAKGQILVVKIDGDGDAKIKLRNLRIKLDVTYKIVPDSAGVEHFIIKHYKYEHEFGDRMSFDLKNIFKDDAELGKVVLNFMNQNWKILGDQFGKPILDYCIGTAMKYVTKFFSIVPARELYGPNVSWPLGS